MSPEAPRQRNMFTGEWDDTRNRRQKKLDRERAQPRPLEMFSPRKIAQFGVKARPLLPLSEHTKLLLIPEDPRTPEEVARDLRREAEANTKPMFSDTGQSKP